MQFNQRKAKGMLDVSKADLIELFSVRGHADGKTKALLLFIGLILTPVTLLGALIYYKKGFRLFMEPANELPRLHNLPSVIRVGMLIGAVLIWVVIYLATVILLRLVIWFGGDFVNHNPSFVFAFLLVNLVLTAFIWLGFTLWRGRIFKYVREKQRHGSARFTNEIELEPYRKPKGFYIGAGLYYNKPGHLVSVSGTRGGKSVNLLFQNLLMPHLFDGSMVIFDPKGELAAVSERVNREAGKKTIILNAWDLLGLGNTPFNPLDILKGADRINLCDDVATLAESIVPVTSGSNESHFSDKARSYISGMILHLMTAAPEEDRHLGTIWSWLRKDNDAWCELLADMMLNDDAVAGEIVKATANEIASLMKTSEREYGSIISTAQKYTDVFKSPALRESLKTSPEFSAEDLTKGNVVLYLIVPADRLKSHSTYMRLVITSLLRSVIRNPGKDVLFLIDEAYAMGYHSEIELALGAYAGFGVHLWTIWQSLVQIQDLYPKTWQSFISNCSVRHFFNISDNFSADYISSMFGQTSVPEYNDKGDISGASARPLVTPDEIRRQSGDTIYTVIDQLAPAQVPKVPYYKMNLDCDPNPYYKQDDGALSIAHAVRVSKAERDRIDK